VVVVCTIVATLAALGLTLQSEKQYESASALLLGATNNELERQVDTNLQLMALPVVARETAQALPGVTQAEVEEAVSGQHEGESSIIKVVATSNSPEKTAEIANAFAETFVAFRGERNEGPAGEQIKVIEKATPSSSPVSPKPTRNLAFGFLIGLALGLSLALLLEQLDRRVKREDDLADATGLPRLAAIPKLKAFSDKRLGREPLSPAETEVFRMLRANLRYFNVRKKIQSVLVTSAEPGEGKSLVSLGLALAAASSGERVLLIEADLRDPGLSSVLELPSTGGLSEVLASDDAEILAKAVVRINAGELGDAAGNMPLDILPAGAIPPNPTELVESQRMKDLIALAERSYDLVVIDTPPVLAASDAIPLFSAVSGVLAVSGLGVSTRRSATNLADVLDRSKAPTLGIVANMVEHTGRNFKGYGYGRPPEIGVAKPGESAITRRVSRKRSKPQVDSR
jgi:tyrosine-protein kinase